MSSLTRRIIAFAIVTVASAVHGSYVPTGAVWRATGGGYLDAGLHGEYYPNTSFSGAPSFTRRDVRIDFDWGTLLPVGGSVSPAYASFPRDGYSVRWTGRIMARFSETYTFKAVADDTFTLEIKPTNSADWATVISSPAPATNGITGTLALLAGVPYDIRISYTEQAGAACARLFWSSPSTPEEVIDPITFHGLNAASWAANYCFADLMKRARWSTGTRDAEGWPTSDADLVLADGVDNLHGTYLMEFKGRATVRSTVSGASFLVGTNWITTLTNGLCYDAESNTTRTQMKTGNVNANWIFRFEATQRDNGSPTNTGVTNVRFMRPLVPGTNVPHEAGEVTYRPIREAFGQYSALRWLNVANVDPSFGNWALRTRPVQMQFNTSIGGTNSGECWEYLVMMANECGKDLNVTTPMQADNEYFTKLALLLKYGSDGDEPYQSHQSNPVYPPLNPNLCVYVEVANEIWNWAFGSTQYAQRQGALEVLSNTVDGAVMNYDGKCGTGGIVVTRRYHAVRSVRCSDAFRGVFGDEAMGNRVLMLLEQQYDNAQTETYYSYRFVDNYFNNADGAHVAVPHPLRHYFWGGGGATYYGTGNSYGDQTNIFLADPSFALPVVPDGTAVPGTQGGAWTFTNNAGIYRNASAGVSTQALGTARTVAEPTAVGMRIRTGSATVYVHELGRWYTAGQGGVHTCQLVRASDRQLLAEVRTTGQSGATVKKFSNFRYGRIMAPGTNLPSPVALAPNTEYYIVSFEGPGGDSHRKEGTTVAPGSWFSVEGAVSATLNGAATNPAAWTIDETAGANLCYGPVNVRCTTNGALAYTRFPWPSFDDQAAFIISNGALSTSVYFDRTGVFAVTFMAAGNGNEYPSYEYFDILADGVCISPRSQTDYRVSPGRAGIGGWSRSTSNFEEYWGSSVFNVTNTGMHTIAFAGCSSKTNNCTVFDEIAIASVDEIMNSGFGSGEALGQVAQADYMKQLNAQARYSKAFGLETVAYEAGLSIGGDFTKRPIQMYCYFGDPRGRTMNNAAMDIFTGSGGQMNVWGVYLYWPVYDIVGSKTYPLMRSLADLSGRLRAEGSNGIPVPASLGTNGIIRWIYNNTDSTTTLTNPGAWATWVITCPETRNYSVQVNAASGGVARFEIDGRTIWEAGTHLASGEYARVTLCKGVHGVRIQNRGGAFTLPANGAVVIAPAFPADAPVLAPAPGTYPVTNVTITTATPGATIRYTVDGSVPTEDHGTIYGGPVALSNTAVISAVAFGDNTECSSVVSGNYAILACGISTNAVAVPEGGSATFQVWLTAAPAGTKTVTISRISGDTDISVSAGATRIFTAGNWAAPQTVTLSAAEDLDIHDGSAVILCAAPGVSGAILAAHEDDNDTLGIGVSADAVVVPEGGTNGFSVYLTDAIASPATVTVARAGGDADITVATGTTFVFTPADWGAPRQVILAAAEDSDAADGAATIRCATPGLADTDVTASEGDNDTLEIEVTDTAVTIPEGGVMAFDVRLTAAPVGAGTVVVSRVSGDADITVGAGTTLVFTPATHATWQTVTLAAGEDADASGGSATIRCACDGASGADVAATEDDNDVLAIVAAGAVTVPEGGEAALPVSLSAAPDALTTVTVARTAGDADITIAAGASLVFSAGDWNMPRTVTLAAAGDADMSDGSAVISCTAPGALPCDVTARERDAEAWPACYDGFDATQRVLYGALTGIGWSNNAWQVESPTNISTYRIVNGSLVHEDLATGGNKAEGGYAYQTSGRSFSLSQAFAPWMTNIGGVNYIGRNGTELWVSYVTRLASAAYAGKLSFDDGGAVFHDNSGRVRVRQTAGKWCLSAIADSYASTSSVAVAANTNYLMVLHFTFAPTDTVELFVNPALDGGPPAGPDASVSVATNDASGRDLFRFYDLNWQPGSGTANGWLDELRFGPTFASVTPRIAGVFTNTDDIAVAGMRYCDERSGWTIVFTGAISGTGTVVMANGMTNILVGTVAPGYGPGALAIDCAGGVTRLGAPDDFLALEIGNGDMLVLTSFPGAVSLAHTTVAFLDGSTGGMTNWFLYSTSGIADAFAGVTFAPGTAGTVVYDGANNRVGVFIAAVQPVVVVSTNALTVAEGMTGRFGVRLGCAPAGIATVTVSRVSGDTDVFINGGGALCFTPANWSINQPVTLQTGEDADASDGVAVFRCVSAGSTDVDVTATEGDNDTMAIAVSSTAVPVPEGGAAAFNVWLTAAPETAATVSVSRISGDADLGVQSGAARVFTVANWATPQPVTLEAAEDADMADGSAVFRCASPGMAGVDVTATEDDNDTTAIIASHESVSVPEGGTAEFQVWLSAAPPADTVVSVARTAGDTDISISAGASLTFTTGNWGEPQTVTLEAAEDADMNNGAATITCSASGIASRDVAASEEDNDAMTLCYDGLDVTQRLLQGTLSGIGWSNNAWQAESPTNISAYRVVNGSLEYGGLVTAGNKIEGGYA
ncbi:hypothetical protein GX586_11635, partial [bacterium]|nr:hypothetical protein [bacterium]